MNNPIIDLEKIKSLAKDENSFFELLNIFESFYHTNEFDHSSENEVIDQLKSGFDNVFWYIKNAETNEFIFYSDSVENITGYRYADLIKMPGGILSLVHDEDLPRLKNLLADFVRRPDLNSVNFDYRSFTKNDEIIWFRSHVSAERDSNNKIINYRGITFEITDLKEKELAIENEKKRLIEVNAAKDRFIAIVSHDLRTPFTSLLGFSEILMNEKELTEHEKHEYLEYIYIASKTQLQMINHLLDWSRLQTGKLVVEPSRVNLYALISNCVSVMTGAAMRKNIEIKTNVPEDLFIQADERLTNQAISNLLSNAIKFTQQGKKVHISADKFKKGFLEIIVKDEGIGIPEKNQDKLFRIDYKFSREGTKGEKGSGLGLTLVKEIIDKHHGEIWFYSTEGEGTEFHITLPEATNLVFIIETDKIYREELKKTIELNLPYFEIMTFENGYEALTKIFENVPTVLILNHFLPLMDGIQFLETLNQKISQTTIPTIVLMNNQDLTLKNSYIKYGISKFLDKTEDASKLPSIIINALK